MTTAISPFVESDTLGKWVIVDEPYEKPAFKDIELDFARKPYLPTTDKKLGVLGVTCEATPEGELQWVEIAGVKHEFKSAEQLFNLFFNMNRFLLVTYYGYDLDLFLKTLGEESCRQLFAGGSVIVGSTEVRYANVVGISLKRRKEKMRIQSVSEWFGLDSLNYALRVNGITESGSKGLTKLVQQLNAACSSILGIMNGDLASPSLLTTQLLHKAYRKVDAATVPLDVYELAYTSFHAPWIEMFEMGCHDELFYYDMNAAYPSEVGKLLNIDDAHGTWRQSHQYEQEAAYGFCYAEIQTFGHKISPILVRKGRHLYAAKGSWVGTITKDEIDFLHRFDIGRAKVLSGQWFFPKKLAHPFKSPVNKLSQLRGIARQFNNPMFNLVVKLASARLVGKFLQKHTGCCLAIGDAKAAPTFNPVYATLVMTRTKLRIAELAMLDPSMVVSTVVDGLATKGELPTKSFKDFGDVQLKNTGSGLVVSPYAMYFAEKRTPYSLLRLVTKHPLRAWYLLEGPRRHRMCEALRNDRFHKAGEITNGDFIVEIGKDKKRYWSETPHWGTDVLRHSYTSEAHLIETLELRYPTYQDPAIVNLKNLWLPHETGAAKV